jgi:hypothetical protein
LHFQNSRRRFGESHFIRIRCIQIDRDEAITLVSWQNEKHLVFKSNVSPLKSGGREGIRTPGLLVANEALSQLSYSPTSSVSILANAQQDANERSGLFTKKGGSKLHPLI